MAIEVCVGFECASFTTAGLGWQAAPSVETSRNVWPARPPELPRDPAAAHNGSHGLPDPLFDHRFPWHQAEAHAIIEHRKATANELHAAAVDPSHALTV